MSRFAPLALTAVLASSVGACESVDPGAGTGGSERAPAGPPVELSANASFLRPTDEGDIRDLFEVETPDPDYWRLYALDRFDGATWSASQPFGWGSGRTWSTPATLPQDPGSAVPVDAGSVTQTFRFLSDFDIEHALPLAPTASAIGGSVGEITWDPHRGQAFAGSDLDEGTEYTVRSRIVVPTPEELDRVEFLSPREYGGWTELPADIDPAFARIAEGWTAGAGSNYRKVLAIQQRFQEDDFVYSTDVAAADDTDALLGFLTRTKTGFCVQYSTAMAVLVRSLGLPARVALGFRAGTLREDGSYLVTTQDAHVWVEVLFPGYGWLAFEPEHGATHPNALPGTYLNP